MLLMLPEILKVKVSKAQSNVMVNHVVGCAAGATRFQRTPRGVAFRLHSIPAIATNHTSTDRSTCTTSATRKKSAAGCQRLTPGVRASTSRIENSPEPISAEMPSHSQPRATVRCAASGCGSAKAPADDPESKVRVGSGGARGNDLIAG